MPSSKLRFLLTGLAVLLVLGLSGVASPTAHAAKAISQFLVGKPPLAISPLRQQALLAAKGNSSFICIFGTCACRGDEDCNRMFSENTCDSASCVIDNHLNTLTCFCHR